MYIHFNGNFIRDRNKYLHFVYNFNFKYLQFSAIKFQKYFKPTQLMYFNRFNVLYKLLYSHYTFLFIIA